MTGFLSRLLTTTQQQPKTDLKFNQKITNHSSRNSVSKSLIAKTGRLTTGVLTPADSTRFESEAETLEVGKNPKPFTSRKESIEK